MSVGMSNPSVPRCSHQPVDTGRSRREEHIVDITFTIAHADDVRAWTVRLECIQLLASFKPFRAFLLTDRPLLAKMFLAKLFGSTYPGFHAYYAEWQALRRERKQAVYQEATDVRIGAISQAFGCWQVGQIEFSCVLHCKDDGDTLHTTQCLTNMSTQHPVDIDVRIIKKTIGRL
ncbi:hypothetical protein WQE_05752 [Paraburkholderia hospita]|uniref:Uncharacterized protein n=1 Tax=Paraburkholderia hospita TaxID=169430 RepID=A0ABP2PXL2_9BURK|nr:hypothetical protein WQE_05752 [Paraburkholderia hospita]